jgi:glutathione peroxidase
MASPAAALTSLRPAAAAAAAASRLPSVSAAASFVRVPTRSTAWAGPSISAQRPRRRAPGVAYATAATEKSIYDFTVKVTVLLS